MGISDNVTYFVEQMDPTAVDTFHYKVQFRPEELLPDVDVQAVSMNVADYLGVDNWPGWWDVDEALEELYPDYAEDYGSCRGVGKREVATILSCEDFNDLTSKGSVVVTEKHGTDQHWVTANRFEAEGIRHDADVLLGLILEQDCVNVLIDPGHGA